MCAGAGFQVAKGTRVLNAIYALHRDDSVWPDAERFIPERHLSKEAEGAPTQPHAWFGFGTAPFAESFPSLPSLDEQAGLPTCTPG